MYANDKHNYCSNIVIGSKGIIQLSSGYVHKTYSNQKTTLTLVGNVSMGSLSFTVKLGISGVTVNMSDVQFPIPWLYDIHIGDGVTETTLNAPHDYKIITGASVTVEKNATLNTSKSVIVYSQFTDVSFGGSVYPNKAAASFTVNGTLNIVGSFGGTIRSTESGAKIIVSSSATLSVSSREGNSGNTKSWQAIINTGEFVTVATISETAKFEDGTALEKGKTYTYNGTAWA